MSSKGVNKVSERTWVEDLPATCTTTTTTTSTNPYTRQVSGPVTTVHQSPMMFPPGAVRNISGPVIRKVSGPVVRKVSGPISMTSGGLTQSYTGPVSTTGGSMMYYQPVTTTYQGSTQSSYQRGSTYQAGSQSFYQGSPYTSSTVYNSNINGYTSSPRISSMTNLSTTRRQVSGPNITQYVKTYRSSPLASSPTLTTRQTSHPITDYSGRFLTSTVGGNYQYQGQSGTTTIQQPFTTTQSVRSYNGVPVYSPQTSTTTSYNFHTKQPFTAQASDVVYSSTTDYQPSGPHVRSETFRVLQKPDPLTSSMNAGSFDYDAAQAPSERQLSMEDTYNFS